MVSSSIDDLLKQQTFNILKEEQVKSFMEHGFCKIEGAIPVENCDWWTRHVWTRMGSDPNDKSTWNEINFLARSHSIPAHVIAPTFWKAVCELLGGEDRIHKSGHSLMDSFIINLGTKEGEGKIVPPKELKGWHCDGDFFIHFLDSPEQALLVIPCWSDVDSNGGATWVSNEGIPKIGKLLYDHPEGLSPMMGNRQDVHDESVDDEDVSFFNDLARESDDSTFYEMTGKKGDVILMHPLMLHSVSKNALRKVRIITNPPISLNEPFNFNRANPADYSLVELKTIKDLGGPEKFKDWKITGEREIFVPRRMKKQSNQRELENERLVKAGFPEQIGLIKQVPALLEHLMKDA